VSPEAAAAGRGAASQAAVESGALNALHKARLFDESEKESCLLSNKSSSMKLLQTQKGHPTRYLFPDNPRLTHKVTTCQ